MYLTQCIGTDAKETAELTDICGTVRVNKIHMHMFWCGQNVEGMVIHEPVLHLLPVVVRLVLLFTPRRKSSNYYPHL